MTSTSLPRHTNGIEDTGAALFGGLVCLGRLVLVAHASLIGYAIGYLQSQDPHDNPGLLI